MMPLLHAGTIALTGNLVDAFEALFAARIPKEWLKKSWEAATLGSWFTGLLARHEQLNKWLSSGRPKSFWMTGFFNPQASAQGPHIETSKHLPCPPHSSYVLFHMHRCTYMCLRSCRSHAALHELILPIEYPSMPACLEARNDLWHMTSDQLIKAFGSSLAHLVSSYWLPRPQQWG